MRAARATQSISNDAWRAIVNRDARQDGRFVYAVQTTGVFCRPSCGSRRPLRANVRVFDTTADAEHAGFRACKRCRPTEADASTALASRVRTIIDASGENGVTLDALARATGASPTKIQRAFTRIVGLSPKAYQDSRRAERLRARLRAGDSVTRATIEAGYGSTSRVHRAAGALGMSPRNFRDRGKGMRIEYGTTSTPLGTVLVAYTERGICSVALGDQPKVLESELREQFSAAVIEPAGKAGRERIAGVVGALSEGGATPAVDLAGTDFQLLVWRALQRIPRGETRSYRAVAESVGRPTAVRAVARACAQNRVAVLVPCHRVIREDGDLGGYRWGVERKRRLLDREAPASKP